MSSINRRDLLAGLTALAAIPSSHAQSITNDPILSAPRVFLYEDLPTRQNANGSESRSVTHGATLTGEYVEIHESTIPVGAPPNPLHQHRPTDILMVREGTVAFEHNGKSERVGPGGVILATSMTAHTIRNVGDVPARYFVVGISSESPRKPV